LAGQYVRLFFEVKMTTLNKDAALEWHWSTSDEGPMYACGTDDVTESLEHALYESGIATFGEDQTSIFLCRFRPLRINWEHHAEWLLEHIDDTVIDHVAEDAVPTENTDVEALATALAAIVKVDASVAYDQCEFAPGDDKYETALLRVRNDAASSKRDAAPASSAGDQA
jgi:hypothetical protein